jgi:hypothetical protein
LTKSGNLATVRFSFALSGDFECNPDLSSVDQFLKMHSRKLYTKQHAVSEFAISEISSAAYLWSVKVSFRTRWGGLIDLAEFHVLVNKAIFYKISTAAAAFRRSK